MSRRDEIAYNDDISIELANDRQAIQLCTPNEMVYLPQNTAHTLVQRLVESIKALSDRGEPPAPSPVYFQHVDGEFAEVICTAEHRVKHPSTALVVIGGTELNVLDLANLHKFILKVFDYHEIDVGEIINYKPGDFSGNTTDNESIVANAIADGIASGSEHTVEEWQPHSGPIRGPSKSGDRKGSDKRA